MYPEWMMEYIRRGQKLGRTKTLHPCVIENFEKAGLRVMGCHVVLPPKEGGLYLNLGCGTEHLEGYINIDIDPQFEPDLVADFKEIHLLFEKDSVDGIVMTHSFPYLSYIQALDLVARMCSVLKPKGHLLLQQSDYAKLIKVAAHHPHDFEIVKEVWRGLYAFDGMLEFGNVDYAATRLAWEFKHLAHVMTLFGFINIKSFDLTLPEEPELTAGWRDSVILGEKKEGITGYKLFPRIADVNFDKEENKNA